MGPHRVGHDWSNLAAAAAAFLKGFPAGTGVKEPACQCRRCGFESRSGKAPGGGHGYPLLYSCLENPMNRGAWWATVHRVTKNWALLKQLSKHAHSLHDIDPPEQYRVSYPAPGSAGQAGSAPMEMDSYEHLIPKSGRLGLPCLFSPNHQLENHSSFPTEAWKEDQEGWRLSLWAPSTAKEKSEMEKRLPRCGCTIIFILSPCGTFGLFPIIPLYHKLFCLDIIEEGKATHSSSLAWSIPRTQEPGRLPSIGSKRVGHDWATQHAGMDKTIPHPPFPLPQEGMLSQFPHVMQLSR